jgi:hypothetical protein
MIVYYSIYLYSTIFIYCMYSKSWKHYYHSTIKIVINCKIRIMLAICWPSSSYKQVCAIISWQLLIVHLPHTKC